MNKANKINPIDIIFVRILIHTKVMKKITIVFQKVCKFLLFS